MSWTQLVSPATRSEAVSYTHLDVYKRQQYTLSIVILAGALLLAGLANRFEWEELRAIVVVLALVILLVTVIMVIRLPMAD